MAVSPQNAWDRFLRAMRPLDPNNMDGPWTLLTTGTQNTIGGGTGGTSMVDDNPFTPGGTSITPMGGYVGGRQVSSGNAAAPALSASAILQVEVLKQPAGGGAGFASAAVYGSPAFPVYIVGSVNVVNGAGGFASVAVYGSPANPVYAVNLGGSMGALGIGGSMGVTQIGAPWSIVGSMGATNLGGSVGVTQLGAPWTVTGSMGVTPLASFTVNQGSVATVNLGLGTVNIGNAHGIFGSVSILGSVNLGGQPISVVGSVNATNLGGSVGALGIGGSMGVTQIGAPWTVTGSVGATNLGGSVYSFVDTRGLTTPTVWQLAYAGSGYLAISIASLNPAVRTKFSGAVLIATGTADITFQSPSGTYLTGSMRLLPGAGFVIPPAGLFPWLIGASNATLYIHGTGTQNIGGALPGFIE